MNRNFFWLVSIIGIMLNISAAEVAEDNVVTRSAKILAAQQVREIAFIQAELATLRREYEEIRKIAPGPAKGDVWRSGWGYIGTPAAEELLRTTVHFKSRLHELQAAHLADKAASLARASGIDISSSAGGGCGGSTSDNR